MAHAGFFATWRPALAAALLALGALYGLALRTVHATAREALGRSAALAAGLCAAYAVLAGPMGVLAGHGVFSARVAQYVALTFCAAPLCLAGLPPRLIRRALARKGPRRAAAAATRPSAAILVFHGLLGLCLLPAAAGLFQADPALAAAALVLLSAAAIEMWVPLMVNVPELPAPPAGVQALYLFINWLLVTIAFAVLLFAQGLPYDRAPGAVPPFGLNPDQDRQVAAVVLGLGSHAAYLIALATIFYRWAGRETATANPGHLYERLRGGGWTDAEARRIAGLPPAPGRGR